MAEARSEKDPVARPGAPPAPAPGPPAAASPAAPADAPARTGSYEASGKQPDDIQRDIQHTRDEMSETVDALGARLRPDYIQAQAKDAVRSTARDAGQTMLDTLRDNPLPSLIAGLSVGWLFFQGGRSGNRRDEDYYYEQDSYRRYPARRPGPAYRRDPYVAHERDYDEGNERSASDAAREKAEQARRRASETAGEAKEQASHAAHRAEERLQDAGQEAQRYGRRASNWLERQMRSNPLAMGAVSLAAGALVGLSVPETQAEHEWMGDQSDQLKRQARQAAEEKLEQAERVAKETAPEAKAEAKDLAEQAKQKAKKVAHDAKDEAKKQDLDEPPKTTSKGGSSKA